MDIENLYNEFNKIVEEFPPPMFLKTEHVVQGYNVHTFIYKLAHYNIMKQNILSREMRGATFVFNKDNSLYRFYPSLHKFYNINENESSLLSKLEKETVMEIMYKEDGVLATFVELPNKKIVAKTKGSFSNDESKVIQELYNNDITTSSFVKECLNRNVQPFFEYVDPNNKIVLNYEKKELKLLTLKNNDTLNYLNTEQFIVSNNLYYPNIVRKFNNKLSLTELVEKCKVDENYEGYVIRTNNNFYKIKTEWYFRMHRLTFDELTKENDIIRLFFEKKLDDAVATLHENMVEKRLYINNVVNDIISSFNNIKSEVLEIIENFKGETIKDLALKYQKHELFSIMISTFKNEDIDLGIEKFMLRKCKKFTETKQFLGRWK